MATNGRLVHLVGSIPAANAEAAMRMAIQRLGGRLRSLPDGETGERRNWVAGIIDSLRHHPDLEEVRVGDWSDYDHVTHLKIKRGHRLRGDSLEFGYLAAFETNFPTFCEIRGETGFAEFAFQVGIPGDLDMALFALGPVAAFRHRKAFTDATVREISTIYARAGSSILFQIEVPAELVFVAKMPDVLRPAMAARLADGIVRLAERAPEGARFGVHLCVGDLGNKALVRMRDMSPVVALANAIVSRWPTGRPLEYVHAPFAAGDEPAPLDEEFYRPLARLHLPEHVRFAAGFVHEDRDEAEHRRILTIIEDLLGRQVDVAAACGLGRRSLGDCETVMDRLAELVRDG